MVLFDVSSGENRLMTCRAAAAAAAAAASCLPPCVVQVALACILGWWDDDSVAVLPNVNIVDESIYGCNDIYLTHAHIFLYFSDVSA